MKKMQNFTRFGMFLLMTVLCAFSASAIDLPSIKVPRGGSANSQSFSVPAAGTLTVNVRVRVAPLVILPVGGTSRYKAELIRPDGTPADTGERLAGADFVTIQLSTNVTCQQTGSWKIKVTNNATENRQDGDVDFPPFNVPTLDTTSGGLSAFTVPQGTDEVRSIPESLEPRQPGGRLRITATWDGFCLDDVVNGCRATLTILRNGSAYKVSSGGHSTGFAHNAAGGLANPKATIDVYVPAGDVNADWTLRVKATSSGTISNVKPTVKFTESCN